MGKTEWKFDSRKNACVRCGADLRPGERLFSAIYVEGDDLLRRDFCPACWPEACGGNEFSFWASVVPEPANEETRKKKRIEALLNTEMLLDILREMADAPDPRKRRFRFVLALMIMRRKKLKLVEITQKKLGESEEAAKETVLVLREVGKGARRHFDIVDVKMSEEEMIAAQDEVGKVLAYGGVEAIEEVGAEDASAAESPGEAVAAADGAPGDGTAPDATSAARQAGSGSEVDED